MAKPTILAVADDSALLSAITRDLQRHYGRTYRIVRAGSGAAALATLDEWQRRDEPVALFLVDQRMPEMDGITNKEHHHDLRTRRPNSGSNAQYAGL